ncbi:MAG: DUF4340 domain-containing protein [Pseudomonadota bacterium]
MFNKLSIFSLVTLVVIIAAVVFVNLRAPQSDKIKPLFFPTLTNKIETVSKISIKSFDNSINLTRVNDVWTIDEFDGYPALPDKVKSTVLGVADLKLNAPKTALERLYPRLGVEGPVADESTSTLLTLADGQGDIIVDVIVGKPRRSSTAQSTPGLYIRESDQEQSFLVDGLLDISAKNTDWLNRSLLDIPDEVIKRVSINHDDGDTFTLFKTQQGQESFRLENMPADKKLAPDIIINRFAAILADVQITSVKKAASIQTPEQVVQASIETFDGLLVKLKAFEFEGRPFVSFQLEALNVENKGEDEIKDEDMNSFVAGMNQKLNTWAFEIQGFKFDILKNRFKDIVRDNS